MVTIRSDETWHRLRDWTSGQARSERLAAQILLSEGYKRLDPSHPLGGRDGGKDAVVYWNDQKWIMAVYFPRGKQTLGTIKKKFTEDLAGVSANNACGMVFVCNQEIKEAERDELRDIGNGKVEIYHLERIVAVLDQPPMHSVRAQFLKIAPEDTGRSFADIAAEGEMIRKRIDAVASAIGDLVSRPRKQGPDYDFVGVTVDGRAGIYAQFKRSDDGIYAELVASRFLAKWHRLSEEREELLIEHGWNPPTGRIPNFHRRFGGRWQRTFARDVAREVYE